MQTSLSKSTFIRGLQCHKSLYLLKRFPELRDEVSGRQQGIFDQGTDVGVLARQLFPRGENPSLGLPKDYEKCISRTRELIDKGANIIYEAGFSYDNVHCFVDILVKKHGLWKAYEVKSSTAVSELYLWDTALQYFVMTHSGLDVDSFSVIHLNNQYVRKGKLNLSKLFTIVPVTGLITRMQEDVENSLKEMKQVLAQDTMPMIDIGQHCTNPYDCDFRNFCWNHVPEKSIFGISGLNSVKKWELYAKGVIDFKDIPADFPLNPKQWQQVQAELSKDTYINRNAILDFLDQLEYPLYFLDFESFQPAIPLFDHTRPYQQVVFQYSLHIINAPGEPAEHREFLARPLQDTRIPFIQHLISDLGTEGSIIVYNRAFEAGRLREIARDFPEFEEAIAYIVERILDLMVPFQQRYYYVPEMKGSYSIKNVLPALVPEMHYNDLKINDGGSASFAFAGLLRERNIEKIKQTRRNLLDYCKMDTLAMVHILNKLEEEVDEVDEMDLKS